MVFAVLLLNMLRYYSYQRSIGEWGQAMLDVAVQTILSFLIIGLLYTLWRGLIEYFSPSKSSLTTIGHYLFGFGNANRWSMLPWYVGLIFVASFFATGLIEGSETDQSIHSKIGFCLMYPPFIIGCVLLHGIPKLYSRLWLTGSNNNRNETALTLLLSLVSRILPSVLLVIAFSLAVAMSTSAGVLPTFVVLVSSLSLVALIVWTLVIIYPWIARHPGFFVLSYLAIACSLLVFVVSNANEIMLSVAEFMNWVGVLPCVAGSIVATTAVWIVCIWVAARHLGGSWRVMEVPDTPFVNIAEQ
jgi:hypothetical protein